MQNIPEYSEIVKEFAEIFQGNQKTCGRLNSAGKGWCEKIQPVLEQYARHLNGRAFQESLGIYPLCEDGTVYFAACDVDNHKDEDAGELAMHAAAVRDWLAERGITAYIEVSKSGGFHIWIFFIEPVSARDARRLLREGWQQAVGGPAPEIFPKQDRLDNGGFGNFIHLPYYPPSIAQRRRVMTDGGRTVPLEEFLQTVKRHTPAELAAALEGLSVTMDIPTGATTSRTEKFERRPTDGPAELMLRSCMFLKHCQLNAAGITYDEWLAALTNIVRAVDGIQAAHDISALDPGRYQPEDTDKKINEALNMNPQTCDYVQKTIGFQGCHSTGCGVQAPCGWSLAKVAQARARVRNIPDPTPDTIFVPEVLGALAVLKKDDQLEYAKFKGSCRGRINLNDLEKIVKQYRLQAQANHLHLVQPGEDFGTGMLKDSVPDLPVDLALPPNFKFKESGILFIKETIFGDVQIYKAAGAPVVISERLFNVDLETEKLEICFRYLNGWRRVLLPRSTVFDTRKILQLADFGIPVSSESAKYLVKWFDALADTNKDCIPVNRAVSKLGWRGHEFVLPGFGNEYRIDIEDGGSQQAVSGFTVAGSREEWIEKMKYLRWSPKARFILSSSFAAPLLRILGLRNSMIHNWGPSRGGKTATLWAAMSVWGNPDRLLGTFDTTATAMERKAALHSDLPLAINEREVLTQNRKNDINPLLYILGEGRGRGRGTRTGLQNLATWRTIVLTTGEGTLSNERSLEGVMTRVLEICDGPLAFDETFAKNLYSFLPQNHGHAGREFLNHLLEADYNTIHATYQGFQTDFCSSFPENITSHVDTAACVATADYLASAWIFGEPWEQARAGAADNATQVLAGLVTRTEASESERAWEAFVDWLAEHEDRFTTFLSGPCFGYRDGTDLYVIRNVLNEFLSERFSNSTKIISEWGQGNKIQVYYENGKKRYDTRHKRVEGGVQPRVVKVL